MSYIDYEQFEQIQDELIDAVEKILNEYDLTNLEVRVQINELEKYFNWTTLPNCEEKCTHEEEEK